MCVCVSDFNANAIANLSLSEDFSQMCIALNKRTIQYALKVNINKMEKHWKKKRLLFCAHDNNIQQHF